MSTPLSSSSGKKFSGRGGRIWTSGFLLLGVLVSPIGSLLVLWHAHIDTDPQLIGLHFLALNVGYVTASAVTQRAILRLSVRIVAVAAALLATLSLVGLLLAAPPSPALWRVLGLGCLGYSAGTLLTALLFALGDFSASDLPALTNRAGILFGSGTFVATAIIGATYFTGAQFGVALLAIIPTVFLVIFATNAPPPISGTRSAQQRLGQSADHRRSLGAVLFSILIFLQFGNEWAIAGWLPLFLIRHLGANPAWSIGVLAVYFLALTFGRVLVGKLLPGIGPRKLLFTAVVTATAGCLALSFSASFVSASVAVIIIAVGFAPIYPLVAETVDDRFRYRPSFYSGLFSIAITGAMSAPWLLGYIDRAFGIRFVMLVPAVGSVAVLFCTLLFMFEARVMGARLPSPQRELSAGAKR